MRCKSCPTEIRWMKHAKTGKPAPIESRPSANGNIRIHPHRPVYVVLNAERAADAREAGEELYLNHFATCEKAEAHK